MRRSSSASRAFRAAFPRFSRAFAPPAPPGLTPLKINCVLLRGFNDDQIEGFARFAREEDVVVRFIEFMPLEEGRLWTPRDRRHAAAKSSQRIGRTMPLVELPPREASETARRYTFADGVGEIGIIAPVSQAFCGACSRVRLTSDGKIRTCLFSQVEHDLYGRLRAGVGDDGTSRLHCAYHAREGGPASHRRAGLPQALAFDGAHRRLRQYFSSHVFHESQNKARKV